MDFYFVIIDNIIVVIYLFITYINRLLISTDAKIGICITFEHIGYSETNPIKSHINGARISTKEGNNN